MLTNLRCEVAEECVEAASANFCGFVARLPTMIRGTLDGTSALEKVYAEQGIQGVYPMRSSENISRRLFKVTGIVQGVGFRPFVFALAHRFGLRGYVKNHSAGVTIEVEGEQVHLARFADCLQRESPSLSNIDLVEVSELPPVGDCDFQIIESETVAAASTPISPDVAMCDECLSEVNDPNNRRFRYPFTNCTNCGPRYTIIRDIPYDRPLTTMSDFAMCDRCEREYRDPTDRRYHAQPNACPTCGPTVWLVRSASNIAPLTFMAVSECNGEEAVCAFHQCIDADEIVAIKGIGGFHLACSANSSVAIKKLRERKGRIDKPLAIMVNDIALARKMAFVDEAEARLLASRERPIVLLRQRPDSGLSDWIAPGNRFVGIMLPYSPLHALLVEKQSLVMTSGNVSEEPIVRTNAEACERLSSLADAFLLHNRQIHVVCDDSVVRLHQGHELPIRRSRGYAPVPVRLTANVPCILAVGGELKATFCMTKDNYAYMSPHIGDMSNIETLHAFCRAVDHFQKLFRITPIAIACDLHPNYLSSQWARERARAANLPLIPIQHHHAHIAAVLAEHQCDPQKPVIGISFDGTGFGPDEAIWGGEVLIASCFEYQRWGHLKYVLLPGGDANVRHPYRSALAHLWSAGLSWDDRLPCVANCPASERAILRRQLERNLNCAPTSSMGRLFDAVAALIGIRQSVNYEAQAAMEMESLSADLDSVKPYPFSIEHENPYEIDQGPMLSAIVNDVLLGVPSSLIISRFHSSIVQLTLDLCRRAREERQLNRVALSGGVFQNQLLLKHSTERLVEAGFDVLTHRIVPPNDGGLALGQAIIAATQKWER